MPNLKVFLWPFFEGQDKGDGGVRRVVEKQKLHLPKFGIDIVYRPEDADILAFHILMDGDIIQRFPHKPLVAHCHGLYWSEYEWENWANKANRQVIDLICAADIVTSPSEWVSQIIRRHTSREVITVHHGVDVDEFPPAENQGYVLWNKNRIDPICEPYTMQQVATLLPDVRFVSTFGETKDNVVITGQVPYEEAKEYVRHAGVYLCTSRETFGIGTLEAMAAGVPVVGYAWGGQREIITQKVDGYLVKPHDVVGLSEGIRWAIENREEAGKAAIDTAKRFSWDNASFLYQQTYERANTRRSYRGWSSQEEQREPIVSVIVTAYNLEEYLNACLDSVAQSTYKNFECIIVDDASPDRCGEIAEDWVLSDSRFRCIHNTENEYLAGARNTGISAARGEYILPLDADDRITPDAIKILVEALERDRTLHIAYGNVLFVDTEGQPENVQFIKDGHSGWPMEYNFEHHIHLKRNLLPYCSMFRKEVWRLTGGYRTRYRAGEDADFWMRAVSYGFRPAMVTKEDTLIYTDRPNSMSHTEQYVSWDDWFPWVRYRDYVLAGAANKASFPKVHSFEPIAISVVIPVGPGHQKYLLDAVDSVQAQTFRNWECIVVNDTDEPLPNLPSWVRIVETDGGIGPAAARNFGIQHAKGALYIPLDADDFFQPGALESMFKVWEANQDHIVYCDFFDDQVEEGNFEIHNNPDYNPWVLVENGCLHPVTALTPKAYWREVGGYDEELPAWEDWAFQISCAEKGFCSIRCPVPLFTYRKHTGKRRNDNYREFETSKEGILKRFGKYFGTGREELMACGSCGASKMTVAQAPMMFSTPRLQQMPPEGAMLLRCNSDKIGDMTYMGPSGTQYIFSGGEEKYVLQEDVQHFIDRGFTPVAEVSGIREEPVIVTGTQTNKTANTAVQDRPKITPQLDVSDLPVAITVHNNEDTPEVRQDMLARQESETNQEASVVEEISEPVAQPARKPGGRPRKNKSN